MYLVFNTELKARNANDQICLNFMKSEISKSLFFDGYLKNVNTGVKHLFTDLTDEQLKNKTDGKRDFPLFGQIQGQLVKASGFTEDWDVPRQDVSQKWHIKKPREQFMLGVEGFVEVETIELPAVNSELY
jgi:hypothetical protein